MGGPGSTRGPMKAVRSVHALAQTGDLEGLMCLLQENPSFINLRNAVMSQTPLHVAAANNQLDIAKYLLEWTGPEKADREAKNMYGETPLHLGAKNGCSEVVRLLLKHKACKEARANNGMTPLHLAVWFSVRSEKLLTVEALLQYDADVNAKDNDSMTPINYLPKTQTGESLRSLLVACHNLNLKRRAETLFENSKQRWNALESELNKIVGLEDLKSQLRRWAKGMLLDERRRTLDLKVPTRRPPHMAFLGNPGTGKTMVARVLSKLLYMVGALAEDKFVEVQRTDLVGEFVGHTGPKTRRKIKEAEGGVLFVDEAYRLIPLQRADEKDYGIEALEEIMSVMDSGKIVVIFAGYSEPMKRVIDCNEGFRRRVTRHFHFEDLSTHEIAEIVHLKVNLACEDSVLYGFNLDRSCTVDSIADVLEKETTQTQRKQLNGGLALPMLVNAREHLDERIELDCFDCHKLMTLTLEDLHAGLALIPGRCQSSQSEQSLIRE